MLCKRLSSLPAQPHAKSEFCLGRGEWEEGLPGTRSPLTPSLSRREREGTRAGPTVFTQHVFH